MPPFFGTMSEVLEKEKTGDDRNHVCIMQMISNADQDADFFWEQLFDSCDDENDLADTVDMLTRLVFCKHVLQKSAKRFCRYVQLHFVGKCNGFCRPVNSRQLTITDIYHIENSYIYIIMEKNRLPLVFEWSRLVHVAFHKGIRIFIEPFLSQVHPGVAELSL